MTIYSLAGLQLRGMISATCEPERRSRVLPSQEIVPVEDEI
jgi:hypothetical protein